MYCVTLNFKKKIKRLVILTFSLFSKSIIVDGVLYFEVFSEERLVSKSKFTSIIACK